MIMALNTYENIKARLAAEIDLAYKAFNDPIAKSEYKTLGVRIPAIKKLVKSIAVADRDRFMQDFFADPDKTFETVLIAGMLAAKKGERYSQTREYLSRVVPLFGSWAHVDCVTPCLKWADKNALYDNFRYFLDCDGQYEKRFYIMIMFSCCLNDEYIDRISETLCNDVKYGQYYVDMAAAWLLAECLVKYYDKTLPLFTTVHFPKFVHNKAIQKARESFRISPETKAYLNTLKIK